MALNNFKWFFFMLKHCQPDEDEASEKPALFDSLKFYSDLIDTICTDFRFEKIEKETNFFKTMVKNLIDNREDPNNEEQKDEVD